MTLRAIVSSLTNGYPHDQELLQKLGLKLGDSFEVQSVDVGDWRTTFHLVDFPGEYFNSVNFEFEKDGQPHDIMRDPEYNPYAALQQRILAREANPDAEKPLRGRIEDAYKGGVSVFGQVYDSKEFRDGTFIQTSKIVSETDNGDGTFEVETKNSKYTVRYSADKG